MDELQRKEVRKMIREELLKLIPELLGRSLVQLRGFFVKTIT